MRGHVRLDPENWRRPFEILDACHGVRLSALAGHCTVADRHHRHGDPARADTGPDWFMRGACRHNLL